MPKNSRSPSTTKKLKAKKLSNPISTGSGGARFENLVQSVFVASMLTGGAVPCLTPGYPIEAIEFQAMKSGIRTDDCVVTVLSNTKRSRLFAQIKRDIKITQRDQLFGEVISAALADFRESTFDPSDAIALITGPLAATDTEVRTVLHRARCESTFSQFFANMRLANYTSENARKKLAAIREQLRKANGGISVSDEETFKFLRAFHLISYDLEVDTTSSSTYALLCSNLKPYGIVDAASLLVTISAEVSSFNQTGGTMVLGDVPPSIAVLFKPTNIVARAGSQSGNDEPSEEELQKLSTGRSADTLLYAALLGSWRDNSTGDQAVLKELISNE